MCVRTEPRTGTERRTRVLIVDDAPANRELVLALLESLDLETMQACDGREAVEAAAGEAFDLVLMDLQMPIMDGFSATRAIRAGGGPSCATPILALSASVEPQDVAACRAAGMDDHLPKPISLAELVGKVRLWTAA